MSPARTAAYRFTESGPHALGAGETVVDVDVVLVDAERPKGVALRGEIVRVGRDGRATDEHGSDCRV